MKKIIIKLFISVFCLGCATNNVADEVENREIWLMGTFKPMMMLLGKKEFPKGNRYVVEYFLNKGKANVYFLYDDKVYEISVKRKNEIEYELYTDKGSIEVFKIVKNGRYADLVYFIYNKETLQKIKKQKWTSYYDGLYDKKIANPELYKDLPAYISKLREQYEFARQEQEYFDKVREDEENMKKNK
ncbi:MAG: hypothetical protein KBH06_01725 [Spirochaetes bacterium]|nr:hypothetical protein [Spirochaetota bacterium]